MLSPFKFTAQDLPHDYHGALSVTWAELEDAGFIDWADPAWSWDAYDDAQRERLQRKISARFEYREIGILPWARFRRQFIRKLNEIMPKYKLIYGKLADENTDLFRESDAYAKSRHVFSDYPVTLLKPGEQDYASNAADDEREEVRDTDTFERLLAIRKQWDDVDVMILDELEPLFSSLMAVSLNGF